METNEVNQDSPETESSGVVETCSELSGTPDYNADAVVATTYM